MQCAAVSIFQQRSRLTTTVKTTCSGRLFMAFWKGFLFQSITGLDKEYLIQLIRCKVGTVEEVDCNSQAEPTCGIAPILSLAVHTMHSSPRERSYYLGKKTVA